MLVYLREALILASGFGFVFFSLGVPGGAFPYAFWFFRSGFRQNRYGAGVPWRARWREPVPRRRLSVPPGASATSRKCPFPSAPQRGENRRRGGFSRRGAGVLLGAHPCFGSVQ